ALAMALTTLLTFLVLAPSRPRLPPTAIASSEALTLGLFVLLAVHALRRRAHLPWALGAAPDSRPGCPLWELARALLAVALALGAVIVMVQAGQAAASGLHLPAALLSLVVLAVATSLPNTVVACQLARDGRAIACVEEVLSSDGVNLALGSALPLLFWHD